MRACLASIVGTVPYSQSAHLDEEDDPKLPKESAADWDRRLWRRKALVDAEGHVVVPAMALKMAVDEAVKRLAIQLPGRGKTTYSKFFVAGQICSANWRIGVHIDDVTPQKVWANVDGVRGSGKRVKRLFPVYSRWAGVAQFHILDDVIPVEIFERALREAGQLIGIGRFRPEKGGLYGRFQVREFVWETL